MTYTTILAFSSALYLLRGTIQLIKRRRYVAEASFQSGVTLRDFLRITTVAGLIVLERIVYRHTYSFALGLELTLLKVHLTLIFHLILGGVTVYIFTFFSAEHHWISRVFVAGDWSCSDLICSF
jgi:hypothetical protein